MPSQVKLYLPADLEGGVALRAEADGFWSRAASSMLARLMLLAGYRGSVDEYFFQDSWQGPQRKVWIRGGVDFPLRGVDRAGYRSAEWISTVLLLGQLGGAAAQGLDQGCGPEVWIYQGCGSGCGPVQGGLDAAVMQ